jgi:hypothetical protein
MMMPPTSDLKEHMRNLRTIEEATAAELRRRQLPLRVIVRQIPNP